MINKGGEMCTLSLDSNDYKMKWRKILYATRREATLHKILISPNLRSNQNFIKVTEDHEFLTLKDRELVKKEISKIRQLNNKTAKA